MKTENKKSTIEQYRKQKKKAQEITNVHDKLTITSNGMTHTII